MRSLIRANFLLIVGLLHAQNDPRIIRNTVVSDPTEMGLRRYFAYLMKATPEERHGLLLNDIDRGPYARQVDSDEDISYLTGLLDGNDPDLSASAASHLVIAACDYRWRGAPIREEQTAAVLQAIAAHYEDEDPPVLNSELPSWSFRPPGTKFWPIVVINFLSCSKTVPPPAILPKLVASLQDDAYAAAAARALLLLEPLPKEIPAIMVARIRHPASGDSPFQNYTNQRMREALIDQMSQKGVDDREFVLALAAILDTPDERHGMAAVALSRIGKAAQPAEPSLWRLVWRDAGSQDPSDESIARSAALSALKNIDGAVFR